MANKRQRKHLPFEVFRKEFLRLLDRRNADKIIQRILKNEQSKHLCVRLLWNYVNTPRLAEMSEKYLNSRESALQEAIDGLNLAIRFLERRDTSPGKGTQRHVALPKKPKDIAALKDVLAHLRELHDEPHIRLPLKQLGRDRDWSAALYAKDQLEARLQCRLPYKTVAILLNVADEASDRQLPVLVASAVEAGLKHLRKRLLSA
jgi:hypothetical protein